MQKLFERLKEEVQDSKRERSFGLSRSSTIVGGIQGVSLTHSGRGQENNRGHYTALSHLFSYVIKPFSYVRVLWGKTMKQEIQPRNNNGNLFAVDTLYERLVEPMQELEDEAYVDTTLNGVAMLKKGIDQLYEKLFQE